MAGEVEQPSPIVQRCTRRPHAERRQPQRRRQSPRRGAVREHRDERECQPVARCRVHYRCHDREGTIRGASAARRLQNADWDTDEKGDQKRAATEK